MIERNREAEKLAQAVASGSIVEQATERLIYQIIEVCAGHEKEVVEAMRAKCEEIARSACSMDVAEACLQTAAHIADAIAALEDKS